MGLPNCKIVKLHAKLQKIESAIITQICIECIDLAAFLNKIRMPGFLLLVCSCGQAREIALHVIAHYERFVGCRRVLLDPHTRQLDIKGLVSKPEYTPKLARWFIQLQVLSQFVLAKKLLYENERVNSLDEMSL